MDIIARDGNRTLAFDGEDYVMAADGTANIASRSPPPPMLASRLTGWATAKRTADTRSRMW